MGKRHNRKEVFPEKYDEMPEEERERLWKEYKAKIDKQADEIEKAHPDGKYPLGKHPNSLRNLRPHVLKKEERAKGGRSQGAMKRERKSFKYTLDDLLKMNISVKRLKDLNPEMYDMLLERGVVGDAPLFELGSFAQIVNMLKGDNKAFENIRDTLGEKPAEKAEHSIFSQGIHVAIVDAVDDVDIVDDPDGLDDEDDYENFLS